MFKSMMYLKVTKSEGLHFQIIETCKIFMQDNHTKKS